MRWTRMISVALVASSLVLLASACSSSSDGGGGGGGDCAAYAAAACGKFESCAPFYLKILWGSAEVCKARYTATCQVGVTEPGVSAPASLLAGCTTAYASLTCDALFSGVPVAGCTPQPGTYANGQACGDDAQCQSLFCNHAAGSSCGTCAAAPKVGDACTGRCGANLECTASKCAAPVAHGAVGATCSSAAPCAANLTCFSGTCSVPTGVGKPCGSTAPACDSLKGLACLSGVCSQSLAAEPGQACGLDGSTYTYCAGNGKCKTASGASKGTCLAAADDGQACDSTNGPNCKYGASCVNGLCTIQTGATCK